MTAPESQSAPGVRRERLAVLALMILAVLVRVVFVVGMRESPDFDEPALDARYHVEWARAFIEGRDYHPGPFFRAPLYPWFLSGVFAVFGKDLLIARLVQCLLGAVTTLLVFLIAKRAFDARVGLLAAALAATHWVLVYFDGELLLPVLVVPLDLLALLLSMRLSGSSTRGRVALAGAAWGVAALARPNVLLFVPFVALWLAWNSRPQWKKGLGRAAVLALACFAPILPVTAYNRIACGDSVLISSQAGVNLWIGNNPDSDGSTAVVPGTRAGWWEGYTDAVAAAERGAGRSLAPSEISRFYTGKVLDYVREEPGDALGGLLWKLRLFFIDWELGNNRDVRFFANRFNPWTRFLPLPFGWLAAAGLVGFALSLARGAGNAGGPMSVMSSRRERVLLLAFVLVYAAGVIAFFVSARHRLPVVPPLLCGAAFAAVWCVNAARSRRWSHVLPVVAVIALGGVFAGRAPQKVRTTDANGLLQLGAAYLARGDLPSATEHLREAVRLDPRNSIAQRTLFFALWQQGLTSEAEPHLVEAMRLAPRDPESLDQLVGLLFEFGRLADAERMAKELVDLAPHYARGHQYLGRIRFAGGQPREAARHLADALERDPTSFDIAFSLGLARNKAGDQRGAIEAFARAVEHVERAVPPFGAQAYTVLVKLLDLTNDRPRARVYAQDFVRRFPDDESARELLKGLQP